VVQGIYNVYCVGRNYKAHAEELGNDIPTEPMIFSKTTHSLTSMNGDEVRLPGHQGSVHYEGELVLHIGKDYISGIAADEIVDRMAFGIDFTLRDLQNKLKDKGHPWLPAKGFRHSAPLGEFLPFPGVGALADQDFTVLKNGEVVQRGNVSRMIFDVQTIVDYIGERFGLGAGDLIFTGTPEGVGPVADGDHFEIQWGGTHVASCVVSLGNGK